MSNVQTQTDSLNKQNEVQKTSLRGEASQEHNGKGKKRKPSKAQRQKSQAKRIALSNASAEAKQAIALMVAMGGCDITVNEYLMLQYKKDTGCEDFRTFAQWKKAGYKVKKGAKSFDVWGSPVEGKAKAPAIQNGEETEAVSTYEHFPVCSLFNESQVELSTSGSTETPACNDNATGEKRFQSVKVAVFRRAIEHLERLYHTDRHACVDETELANWSAMAAGVVATLENMDCPRAKPDDLESYKKIVELVRDHLASDNEPTPPKNDGKQHTQDMGNNESLSRGLFPQADGSFMAMTFTASKPFKTETGAINWLAKRGLDANGKPLATDSQETESSATEDDSPFAASDYQGKQDARRDRLEERAEKSRSESNQVYGRSRALVEHIPFGQPILVGHHSERKHRAAVDKSWSLLGKSVALDKKAQSLESRAASVGTGGIAADDPEAITKLQTKLKNLISAQETMKAVNKILRTKKMSMDEKAKEIIDSGLLSEAATKEALTPDHCGGIGFAQYSLSNNNAEIRRVKARIKELEQLRAAPPVSYECEDFSVYIADGRVCIDFANGKPSADVLKLVKGAAFNWSRRQQVWMRKATGNGVATGRRLLESLKTLDTIY